MNEENQRWAGEAVAGVASNHQYQQQAPLLPLGFSLCCDHLTLTSAPHELTRHIGPAQLGSQIAQSSSNPYVSSLASNAQVQQGTRSVLSCERPGPA
jgi:hypothetical protein